MNSITPKLQKCWTHKIAIKIISKMLKQPDLFYSQPATLPKDAPAKFYLSTTFGSSFMISSVAPTRSSDFYAHLITKGENCNLNELSYLIWLQDTLYPLIKCFINHFIVEYTQGVTSQRECLVVWHF